MDQDSKKSQEPLKVMLAVLIVLLFLDSTLKNEGIILIDHAWSNIVLFVFAFACAFIYKIIKEKLEIKNNNIRRTMNVFGILSIFLFGFYFIRFLVDKNRMVSNNVITKEGSLLIILFFAALSYAVYMIKMIQMSLKR